ncbi:MAG TPA: CbiX/SirB N-terminal domain-containing protein [Burkholderiales bacterium]|nr:CbiX/SirB N-terminal domain-containing protein [Burkholderiales bacterium]
MNKHALILFAHGARDPEWAKPFEKIRDLVRTQRPELVVELAYLELMTPRLDEAMERIAGSGVADVTIAPLFMAQGGHMKEDVPRLLAQAQQRHPDVQLRLLPAVGEVDALLGAISAWLVASVPGTQ